LAIKKIQTQLSKNNFKMKKNIILLTALAISSLAYSQVGINNETPKATLDITAKTTDGTKPEGIIAPRLTGDQIKLGDAQYDTPQTGAIVYATAAITTTPTVTDKTKNITAIGYYYFDGAFWQALNGAATEPWKVSGSTTPATSNTQNIYQTGRVGIGSNPGATPEANLNVFESNADGNTGTSFGIKNTMSSNKQGIKYGINNFLYDNSTAGSGGLYGTYSSTIDGSTVSKPGYGGYFTYDLSGAKNNGITTHTHGMRNTIALESVGGDLTSGYAYANFADAKGYAAGGNLTLTDLRAYSGYTLPTASAGHTASITGLFGGHYTVRPNPNGGTITSSEVYGVSGQFDPTAVSASGTFNATSQIAALRSYINLDGAATYNINNLYGIFVDKGPASGTNATINRAIGLYIEPFTFTGANAANSYNIYSEGSLTKNYFEGKVGIGLNAPAAQLHIVKQAADLTPAIIEGCGVYADNTEASTAGLPVGALYRTASGVLMVRY
jgi:hypothetical protein